MPSLLEALERKYGIGDDVETQESLVSIYIPKLSPRLLVPQLLVLNDCDIDRAGEPEDLRQKCCSVKELDLAQNKLQKWSEVFTILTHMPRVEFVNLSLNRLLGPVQSVPAVDLSHIKSLVLNNTHTDWSCVETIINVLPRLEELHLSLNDYSHVLIDTVVDDHSVPTPSENPNANDCCNQSNGKCDSNCSSFRKTNAHECVKRLHFNGNPVTEWNEICRLGRVFPNLEILILAECPLRSVEPSPKQSNEHETNENAEKSGSQEDDDTPHKYFTNLALLNLSNTQINTWNDIDRLAKFPSLRNLRVQNWPLWDRCESTEHERRQLLIARLPFVRTLNGGGAISIEEREDAERAFIRYYMDKPESDRPERYTELLTIHGKLEPLVSIDLRPEKRVKVTFTYGDTSEVRCVDVYRSVVDLKSRLERWISIPAQKMRLFYVDQELRDHQGPEEMRYPHKQLYSYNIRNGDEIIIDQKR